MSDQATKLALVAGMQTRIDSGDPFNVNDLIVSVFPLLGIPEGADIDLVERSRSPEFGYARNLITANIAAGAIRAASSMSWVRVAGVVSPPPPTVVGDVWTF